MDNYLSKNIIIIYWRGFLNSHWIDWVIIDNLFYQWQREFFRKELQHGLISSLLCLFLLSNFFYHSNHSLHTFETKWNIKGSVGLFLDHAHVPHIVHLFVRNTSCILNFIPPLLLCSRKMQAKDKGKVYDYSILWYFLVFFFTLPSVLSHDRIML